MLKHIEAYRWKREYDMHEKKQGDASLELRRRSSEVLGPVCIKQSSQSEPRGNYMKELQNFEHFLKNRS